MMAEYIHNFKKVLGQNYIKDKNILNKIVSFAKLNEKDQVLEIGTGMGTLTKAIYAKCQNIITYEIDKDLEDYLRNNLPANINLKSKDFLDEDLSFLNNKEYKVVANIPYYISTKILEKIFNSGNIPSKMVLLLQKEYVDRIISEPGNKSYGPINVFIKHFYNAKKVLSVKAASFYPVPEVDSAVLVFDRKNYKKLDYYKFSQLVNDSFRMRRKTLNNNLKDYNLKLDHNLRAEDMSLEMYYDLYEKLYKYHH